MQPCHRFLTFLMKFSPSTQVRLTMQGARCGAGEQHITYHEGYSLPLLPSPGHTF